MTYPIKKQLNIWLLQIGEALPIQPDVRKIRTAYLADELTQREHNVLWWASCFDHFKKKWVYKNDHEVNVHNKLKIKMLKGIGYKENISLRRFVDHRIIAWKFRKVALQMDKPDLIVASFPSYDLAYEAVFFANTHNIPVIVDIRDQWPEIFLDNIPNSFKPLFRILLHHEFKLAKGAIKSADSIVSMMDEILNWGLTYAQQEKRATDEVFYLGYKKDQQEKQISKGIRTILNEIEHKFVITFIGTFAEYHDPTILLKCAEILQKNSQIQFVLAGDGKLMQKIKSLSRNLNNVTLTGWLDQTEITNLLKISNIGVCTTNRTAFFFPNKAMAYFSEGLPVLSAFEGEMKSIIEKYQVGYYYSPNDVNMLTDQILLLYENKNIYRTISENVKKVFTVMFDANKIYNKYADHIESMVKHG